MKRESPLASNSSTEPDHSLVGRLGRPHGLEGFLGLYVDEDDLLSFEPGSTVFVKGGPHVVRAIRRVDRGHQVAFEGVDDRASADEIRGTDVFAEGRRELGQGEFWPGDLIGLEVFEQEGGHIGVVGDVIFGAAQDRLVIVGDGTRFEIPFVDQLVTVVDIEARRIEVVPIPGLIEPSG